MNSRSKLVALSIVATLAACGDNATAPRPVAEPSTEVVTEGSMMGLSWSDTISFPIMLDPTRTWWLYLGAGNSLTIPANTMCDPVRSTYGAGQWDKSCTRATSPVKINVRIWMDTKGHPRVDFDAHLRFAPSLNPAQWVVITFSDMEAALNPFSAILYCPQPTSACFDESKTDLSLLTVRNPLTGKLTRRIKHFSGYNVAAGRDGEGEVEGELSGSFSLAPSDARLNTVSEIQAEYPELTRAEAESMLERVREAKRSGYILASG